MFAPGNKASITLVADDSASATSVAINGDTGDVVAKADAEVEADALGSVFAPGNRGAIDVTARAEVDADLIAVATSEFGNALPQIDRKRFGHGGWPPHQPQP